MRRELIGGLTTYFTLAYLLLVYPKILAEGGFDPSSALIAFLVTTAVGTLALAIYADVPFALGPGLGVASYLTYSILQKGLATPEECLGIVFWSGTIVFLLTLLQMRQLILIHLPKTIREGSIGAIGLFLLIIGLRGIDILHPGPETLLALGGLLLFYFLHRAQIGASFLIAILTTWSLSFALDLTEWRGFLAFPVFADKNYLTLDLVGALHPRHWPIILTVVLMKFFDTGAVLHTLSAQMSLALHHKNTERLNRIIFPEGLTSMLAALLGATNATFLIESTAGLRAGARTGRAALVTAACLLASLFFFPIVASLPPFTASMTLIAVGALMLQEYRLIPWRNLTESLPPLLMALVLLLTLSLYEGFAWGFISYVLLKLVAGQARQVHWICWILASLFLFHILLAYIGF